MLGESMKYSAGVGRSYNQSLETITTATALLGGAGIQGSQAGTTMRAILSRIGTAPAMKKLGISTKDKDGNMRDLSLILTISTRKRKNWDPSSAVKSLQRLPVVMLSAASWN